MIDHRQDIDRLKDGQLALDRAITELEKTLPGLRKEIQEFLAGRAAALAADSRAEAKNDILAHITAARLDLAAMIERHMAAVLAKRQQVIGGSALAGEIGTICAALVDRALKEFSAGQNSQISNLSSEIRKEFTALISKPGDPTAPVVPADYAVVDHFMGQWKPTLPLKRGDLFTSRGSTYLTLRDCRGVLPTKQNQQGPNPIYALFCASGSPGMNGAAGAVGAASGLVTFPASSTAAGSAGSFAYSNGYASLCTATNSWVFWATTSDYPF